MWLGNPKQLNARYPRFHKAIVADPAFNNLLYLLFAHTAKLAAQDVLLNQSDTNRHV